jgi:hypothetical protein
LNPRRDAYGGSLANRLRLPLEVVSRVRELVGADFPIGVRFLGEECIRNGYTVVDAAPIAIALARAGVDYVSLSAGGKFEDARRAGLDTPVVAVGKIATRALANDVVANGQGDLVGMARALLADPDLPNKWAAEREDTVVRCVYGNVCKALDESFRRVNCTLWPKKLGRAPESLDTIAPQWSPTGASLVAQIDNGKVVLRWHAATDNEEVYGYEVFRAEGDSALSHYASVRAGSLRFEDARVAPGTSLRYSLKPYDLAGNRGLASDEVSVLVPADFVAPAPSVERGRDPGAIGACGGQIS